MSGCSKSENIVSFWIQQSNESWNSLSKYSAESILMKEIAKLDCESMCIIGGCDTHCSLLLMLNNKQQLSITFYTTKMYALYCFLNHCPAQTHSQIPPIHFCIVLLRRNLIIYSGASAKMIKIQHQTSDSNTLQLQDVIVGHALSALSVNRILQSIESNESHFDYHRIQISSEYKEDRVRGTLSDDDRLDSKPIHFEASLMAIRTWTSAVTKTLAVEPITDWTSGDIDDWIHWLHLMEYVLMLVLVLIHCHSTGFLVEFRVILFSLFFVVLGARKRWIHHRNAVNQWKMKLMKIWNLKHAHFMGKMNEILSITLDRSRFFFDDRFWTKITLDRDALSLCNVSFSSCGWSPSRYSIIWAETLSICSSRNALCWAFLRLILRAASRFCSLRNATASSSERSQWFTYFPRRLLGNRGTTSPSTTIGMSPSTSNLRRSSVAATDIMQSWFCSDGSKLWF